MLNSPLDVAGNVRIWDTTNADHVLKIELKIISGAILDMDWSEDSKRIVAVGEGKEKCVFTTTNVSFSELFIDLCLFLV